VGEVNGNFGLARYDDDGSLDSSFGTGGKVTTDFGRLERNPAVAIQPDGKIVSAGMSESGPAGDIALARYNTDGSLDTSFGIGGTLTTDLGNYEAGSAMVLQPDGKIVVGGLTYVGVYGTNAAFLLVRYNPDGSIDSTFGSGGAVITLIGVYCGLHDIALQPDGKIVAVGSAYRTGFSTQDFAVARYNPDGSLDASFGSGGTLTTDITGFQVATALAIQTDGRVCVAGYASTSLSDSAYDFALVRYNSDGTL